MLLTSSNNSEWNSSHATEYPLNMDHITKEGLINSTMDFVTNIYLYQDERLDSQDGYQYSTTIADKFIDYSETLILNCTAAVLNAIALIFLQKTSKKGKTSSDLFLISQLSFDLASSLLAVLWVIGKALKPQSFESSFRTNLVCSLWYSQFIQLFFANMSIFNCTLLTLERYAKIVFPIIHRIWMSPVKAKVILMSVMGLSFCQGVINDILPFRLTSGICSTRAFISKNGRLGLQMMNFVIVTVIPIATFVFCYSHMLVVLRRRQHKVEPTSQILRSNQNQGPKTDQLTVSSTDTSHTRDIPSIKQTKRITLSVSSHKLVSTDNVSTGNMSQGQSTAYPKCKEVRNNQKKNTKKTLDKIEINLFITALLVNISFIASNAPIRLYFIFWTIGIVKAHIRGPGFKFMADLIYLNYCFHPIIYAFTLKKVRDKLYCCKK